MANISSCGSGSGCGVCAQPRRNLGMGEQSPLVRSSKAPRVAQASLGSLGSWGPIRFAEALSGSQGPGARGADPTGIPHFVALGDWACRSDPRGRGDVGRGLQGLAQVGASLQSRHERCRCLAGARCASGGHNGRPLLVACAACHGQDSRVPARRGPLLWCRMQRKGMPGPAGHAADERTRPSRRGPNSRHALARRHRGLANAARSRIVARRFFGPPGCCGLHGGGGFRSQC